MQAPFSTLPDEFGIGASESLVYFYSSSRSSARNKVVFTRHMIGLLQQGIKEVQTMHSTEVIRNKELLLFASGSTLMSESIAEEGTYEAILVFFGNQTLTEFCVKHSISIPPMMEQRPVLKVPNDEFLEHYGQSLRLLRSHGALLLYDLKIQELLGYLYHRHPSTFMQFVFQALSHRSDIQLRQVVEQNREKGLTVEELAFLCHMSVSTFKRRFADAYQTSPKKYFARLRMEQAKRLLSLSKKASEIYADLGYENLSAFSSEFKKHTGFSPSLYQAHFGPNDTTVGRVE